MEGQKKEDKRSLRSHGAGSRLRSDLAIYFSNYEDVITDAPRQPEFLGIDTPILIVDESTKSTPSPSKRYSRTAIDASPRARRTSNQDTTRDTSPGALRRSSQPAFQTIDFSSLKHASSEIPEEDPLGDQVYFASHRRAERKEKQLRNIEKERAMHEKGQLERLLEGLKGPDWLRVMGVSGITDGERKEWEPKRNYFIFEVEALVDKFRLWKEEERRQRLEKEAAALAREEEEEGEASRASSELRKDKVAKGEESDAPDSSEIDASAAHQLLQEAQSASVVTRRPRVKPLPYYLPPPEPEPTEPFRSFFAKPHLRAAALGHSRHGRTSLAFGQPLPEVEEDEFNLPEDYLTQEALKDHARKDRKSVV